MAKKIISYIILIILIPVVMFLGIRVFNNKQYAWISLCVCILSMIPFFISFENRRKGSKEIIIIAVMVSLGVVGRMVFAPIAGFKPVTAIVVLTALYFGSEAGFMTGTLTAVISNFYFGQGPWTPFQMFAWGMTGLIAGILNSKLKQNRFILMAYGALSGVVFSLLMDIYTVVWLDGIFNIKRYIVAVGSSVSFTVVYVVSNAIFLLVLGKPIGQVLQRVKIKYGIK